MCTPRLRLLVWSGLLCATQAAAAPSALTGQYRVGDLGTLDFSLQDGRSIGRLDVLLRPNHRVAEECRIDLGDEKWNHAASARNLLDVAEHPVATFVSTRIEPKDRQHASVCGTLALLKICKPSSAPAKPRLTGV